MLGKFAVVQRSLLPELLTAATPAPDSSSRQPGRALQLYTPHIEQGFLRMKLSFYLHCWVAMSGNMENCRVLRCWCGVARPGGGAACLAWGWGQARCRDSAACAAIGCCWQCREQTAPAPVQLSTAARTQQQQPHCKFSANLGE